MSTKVHTMEQAIAFNKKSIFTELAKHGIGYVTIDYDGSGDSGQVNEPCYYADDTEKDTVEIPSKIIDFVRWETHHEFKKDGGFTFTTSHTFSEERVSLTQAIEEFAYGLLENKHGGWEINEGSQGRFEFSIKDDCICLHHEENVIEHNVSEISF